jgi:hypothetical protein
MPLGVDENVLRLEIAVRDALSLVQKLEYENDFSGIKLRRWLVESSGTS